MPRYIFGGDIPNFVMEPDDTTHAVFVKPGSVVTFWDSRTEGTKYSDLFDVTGTTPQSAVDAGDDGGIPEFQGPDNVVVMWAQADENTGGRRKIFADLTETSVQAAIDAALANAGLQYAPWYRFQKSDGSYDPRPATARPVVTFGTAMPSDMLSHDSFEQTTAIP